MSAARGWAGLSQEVAASICGVSRQTISTWEKGDGEPLVLDLESLADAYEIKLDALCGRAPLPPTRAR